MQHHHTRIHTGTGRCALQATSLPGKAEQSLAHLQAKCCGLKFYQIAW